MSSNCGLFYEKVNFLLYLLLVIWNPWAQKAMTMSDFGDEEVCIAEQFNIHLLNVQLFSNFKKHFPERSCFMSCGGAVV